MRIHKNAQLEQAVNTYEIKSRICSELDCMKGKNAAEIALLKDAINIRDYEFLVRNDEDGKCIWTDAFQNAVREHEYILIPAAQQPYYIDQTIVLPSNRHIEAQDGAVIKLMEDVPVLMLRNEHTENGTYEKETFANPDRNISIRGGRWEESNTMRKGYGRSGMYDRSRSYFGVSTCMFFNQVENLTLTDMTFVHTAGFSVQVGNACNVVFENIVFEECFADGLHVNGNITNLLIRNIAGQVGDDLVALNMYDWQNSSVDFGPISNVLCENLYLSPESRYKAFRISPGIYHYRDGSTVDCSLNKAIIRNVKGIHTFKMYFQTPRYIIGCSPEKGEAGSCDQIFFENIEIDLERPIDLFEAYCKSDSVTGTIAGFEMGSVLGDIYFENIDVTLHREKYPMSFFLCIGPKSVRYRNPEGTLMEVFDPGVSSLVENLYLKNIKINGQQILNPENYIREIIFNDLYGDGDAIGTGEIKQIWMCE